MARVSFEFSRTERGEASGFDLGNIGLVVGTLRHSSAERTPSQSMMIYLAMQELIDGVCTLLQGRNKKFGFVGADSSYSIAFVRTRDNVMISVGRQTLAEVPIRELLRALSDGVQRFFADPKNTLPPTDPVYEDLQASLIRLEQTIRTAS